VKYFAIFFENYLPEIVLIFFKFQQLTNPGGLTLFMLDMSC
jgi:hypothetical protein